MISRSFSPRHTGLIPAGNTLLPLLLAGILTVSIPAVHGAQSGPSSTPDSGSLKFGGRNLVLVSFDAMQAKHIHCLGYPNPVTPVIDSVAKRAFTFSRNMSVSSWTVPATMSWFTGVYPARHKLVNKYALYEPPNKILANLRDLAPGIVTLAEVLRENGYATAGFTGNAGVSGVFGYSLGFDVYVDDRKFGDLGYSVPKALEWIRENRDRKFFVFLHGYDSHGQCVPADGYDYRFVDRSYDFRYRGTAKEQEALREEGLARGSADLRVEDVKFWRAVYDEKINRADERFGRFLKGLTDLGLMDRTLLVLTSDHGTEVYEHRRFDHGFSLAEELVHVPLIIRVPGQSAGKVISDLTSSIDIMPTILDLLDIPLSGPVRAQMEGHSLTDVLRGGTVARDVFLETDYRRYTYKRAVMTPDGWKFIVTMEDGSRELYNLVEDPMESRNLVDASPRVAYELEQKLFGHLKGLGQDVYGPWETGLYPVYNSQAPDFVKD